MRGRGKETRLRYAAQEMVERELEKMGMAPPHAASAVTAAVARRAGGIFICGPAGAGKTTVAELVASHPGVVLLGDLRMRDEIAAALREAARTVVVAVVRSGESLGLSARWQEMGVPQALIEGAQLTVVTLRRLPGLSSGTACSRDLHVVEVIGPRGVLLSASLAEEARALVSAGLVTDEAARLHVPGYATA